MEGALGEGEAARLRAVLKTEARGRGSGSKRACNRCDATGYPRPRFFRRFETTPPAVAKRSTSGRRMLSGFLVGCGRPAGIPAELQPSDRAHPVVGVSPLSTPMTRRSRSAENRGRG